MHPQQRALVPALSTPGTAEELRGALESVLLADLGAAVARNVAKALVDENAYDCPDALAEVTPAVLASCGIPAGRHTRICKALFGGSILSPEKPVSTNASVSKVRGHPFKTAWPAAGSIDPSGADDYMDFGMSLRAHIRQQAASACRGRRPAAIDVHSGWVGGRGLCSVHLAVAGSSR
jgi:hypothetical protein